MTYNLRLSFFPLFSLLVCLSLALVILACTQMKPEPETASLRPIEPISDHSRIEAGIRIGRVVVGSVSDSLHFLGQPDISGNSWHTWYSKSSHSPSGKYELNIYTSNSGNNTETIIAIRVTSPDFRTNERIGSGSDSASVFTTYKNLKLEGTFREQQGKPAVALYGDRAAGIAVELNRESGKCCAVIIHEPSESLLYAYRLLRPELKTP